VARPTAILVIAAVLLGLAAVTMAIVWWFKGKPVEEAEVRLEPIDFAAIEGWQADDQSAAFPALLGSCTKPWPKSTGADAANLAAACQAAVDLAAKGPVSPDAARAYFEAHYAPFRVVAPKQPGRVTGYYEPEVKGALKQGPGFQVPVYGRPPDLVGLTPDDMRARHNDSLTAMRQTDDGLVPYYTRQEIDQGALKGRGLELVYLADPVELFFMQVQGSSRVRLPDGSTIRLGYASKNGHPYSSIGKRLVELGAGGPKSMSMQGIKEWLRADAARGQKLMWVNRSYVFFRVLDAKDAGAGPIGAQGVALTPGRSLAVDATYHALGLPIFVEAGELTKPHGAPFRRLMVAQDVGSAIKGPERGDIFWGSGDAAGAIAGTTLAPAHFIVLKPNPAPGV
jgi:membrane-bound lytic murein transglycosylase A